MPRTPAKPDDQKTDHELFLEMKNLLVQIHAILDKSSKAEKKKNKTEKAGKKPESVYYEKHKEEIKKNNPDTKILLLFRIAREEYNKLTAEQKKPYIEEAEAVKSKKSGGTAPAAAPQTAPVEVANTEDIAVAVDETPAPVAPAPVAAAPAPAPKQTRTRTPGTRKQ